MQQWVCLCAAIPTLPTRTRVVIVRHHLEAHRSSNTGRLAGLALPNSEIIDHGARAGVASLPGLAGEGSPLAGSGAEWRRGVFDDAWLIYPGGEPLRECPSPPPRTVIVLDATWSQARRMYRKLPGLRGLPLLTLPVRPIPIARLRASPAPGMVSTIEAIAGALRLLEGEPVAAALEALFAVAVDRARATGRRFLDDRADDPADDSA
jgi:DTW domain-containing protein YfiP